MRKGNIEEKCELFYSFFDEDGDNFVTKDEMISCFSEFFEAFQKDKDKGQKMLQLKKSVSESSEFEINQCILDVVNEIFEKYAKKDETLITREEIQKYLYDMLSVIG